MTVLADSQPRVALVTGGSGGIGAAICRHLSAAAIAVGVHYFRNVERVGTVVRGIVDGGGAAAAYQADLAKRGEADRLVRRVIEDFGRLDIVVNNAGVVRHALLVDTTDEDLDGVLAINLRSAFFVTRAAAPSMIARRSGVIVNVSSIAASRPWRGQTAYAASKAALEGLTLAAATELGSKGIRVNAVAPGIIDTAMSDDVRQRAGRSLLDSITLKRYGTPDDVAAIVAFLASPSGAYLTGQIIYIDGGRQYQQLR